MKSIIKKNVVAGLGEIGSPICKLLEQKSLVVGYDLNKKLMNYLTIEENMTPSNPTQEGWKDEKIKG